MTSLSQNIFFLLRESKQRVELSTLKIKICFYETKYLFIQFQNKNSVSKYDTVTFLYTDVVKVIEE
jgi:hypothetical protein